MDITTYALSKKIAAHALSGVQSMSVSGQTLTINTKDSGVLTMTFPTPKDGVSVTDIDVNANNQIVFTMSDGTEFISGKIPTIKGDKGDAGFSPTITENADNTDKIYKLDITTADSIFTTPNLKGADGQSGTGGGEENKIDSISVNGVNVAIDENKNVDIIVPSIEGLTKDEDLATVAKSGDYEDLINKPTIPDITGLATETYVDNKVADYTKTVDLADVATSGSYNDLADKPTIPSLDGYAKTSEIPSKVSELENDSNYLSSIPEEYVTDAELESKGYLTEHQDISGKVDKVEGKSLISDAEIARLASVDNYDDTDIKAEIAKKADATAIPSKVSELTNDSNYQTAEQVNSTVTTEIAKVVADAPESLNTLKEMSDWIAGHEDDASAMNSAISDNKTAITALQIGKADKSEIPTTVAELTDSADYAKTADVNDSISALQTGKADASDLTAHTDDTDIHVTAENKATWNTVSDKVDKEDGKGLSANDYTNGEKALVGTIEDKINKTSIATALNDTVTDEQVASALLTKTELDKKIDKTSIVTELSDASTDDEVIGALTAYNELQKLESATKGQFSTASGNSITVNDSVDGKLVELCVKGNSFQQTYSGKNLLNATLQTTTQNGVTCTNNGDGTYTLNGTATADAIFDLKYITYSGNLKLLGTPSGLNRKAYVYISGKGGDYGDGLIVDSLSNSRAYIYVTNGTTLDNITFKPMITTDLNATYDDFEPYVGGIPAPNPLYPQEIKSVGDDGSLVVKSRGKNMIPFPYYSGMSLVNNGITFTANEDGSVTANGTATSNAFFRFANKNMYSLENGKTYAISRGKTKDIYMFAQNSSGDFVVLKVEESAKFTCNDTWRYIGCYVPKDTTVTNETIYPMLVEVNEDGTYPTEYEPYKSSTSTIPLSEPLRAIGDIKDEITYQDGKWGVLRRIKKLIVDTPTKINPNGALIGTTYDILANFEFEAQDSYNVVNKISDISKHIFRNFQSINVWNKDKCGAFISWSGSTSARLSSSICGSTLDEVKAYFKNNPLIGQYVLAVPVFEPFADQTLPYLSTYDGITNISNDDALSAEMTVKYPTTDASGVGSRNESRIAELAKNGKTLTHDVAEIKNDLDGLGYGENSAKNLFKDYDVMKSYKISSETYNGYPVIYSDQQWEGAYQSDLILKSGITYTISAYIKGNGRAYLYSTSMREYLLTSIELTDNFERFSLVYTPDEDVSEIRIENDTDGGLYIACFQIEEGGTATPYKPYIPSVKMLAEENAQQNIEAMDLKMLGWTVPSECPVQNYVDGDGVFHQRVGRVDLGGLTWNYATNPNRFNANFNSVKFVGNDTPIVAYSKKYDIYSFNTAVNTSISKDKAISVYGSNGIASILVVIDSSYTDADTFKNAMKGIYLYYELATEISMNVDGNEVTEHINESLSNKTKLTLELGDIRWADGGNIDSTTWKRSGFVKVTPNTKYTLNRTQTESMNIVGYKEDKTVITDGTGPSSAIAQSRKTSEYEFTTTPTTNYIRIAIVDTNLSENITLTNNGIGNTVVELVEDVDSLNESLGAIGKCKNLLNPTLQTTTLNGVTCTNNGDGTYTLNGTATKNTDFAFFDNLEKYQHLKNRTVKLVGCPKGGSNTTYRLMLQLQKVPWTSAIDIGKGSSVTVDNNDNWACWIRIYKDATVSNLTFKPMLVFDDKTPNATYDDFVPYTGEGETLTHDVAELKNDLSTKIYELAGSELYLCVSGKNCVLTLNGYNLTGSTNFSKLAEYPPYLVARNVVSKEDGVCIFSVDPNGNVGASDLQVASSVTGKMFGEVSWVANI